MLNIQNARLCGGQMPCVAPRGQAPLCLKEDLCNDHIRCSQEQSVLPSRSFTCVEGACHVSRPEGGPNVASKKSRSELRRSISHTMRK